MAMMDISVVPVGTGTTSVSEYVAGAIKQLQNEPGIKYELTAMNTIIKATWKSCCCWRSGCTVPFSTPALKGW